MNPGKREEYVYLASSHFTWLSCLLQHFTVCKGLSEICGCWSQTLAEGRLGRDRCLFQTCACITARQENGKAAFESGSEMSARDQGPSRAHECPSSGHATKEGLRGAWSQPWRSLGMLAGSRREHQL